MAYPLSPWTLVVRFFALSLAAAVNLLEKPPQSSRTMSKPPTFIECSVCGREFGSKSIRIHEPQCLSKLRRTEIKDLEVNKNVKPGNKKRNKVSPPGNNSQGSSSQPFYGGVGMTTASKKINLPKIHTNSIIYPSSKLVRPNTATLDKPRILNPDFSYYDMSLTRIDFNNVVPTSSSAHKGMDDNHNTSEAIDTPANRSPFILPAVNTAPATPSNSATAHHTYATSSISTNGSKRSQLSQRGPTTKTTASGIVEMTRVSDAWLGNPLSPSPTGSSHNLKSYQIGAGAAGGGGGLSVLGNSDFGVPPYSREADLVTRPPQSSSFPYPSSEPCGDVPDTQILNSLHFTPIEIDVRHEIVPRTETQPDEEPFLTPSGSFTCILTTKQEPTSEKERVIHPPPPQKTSRFHENVIIVKYGGDDGCGEESLQDEQKPPQPQQTGGGFPEVSNDRVEKGTSTVTQIQTGKIEDKTVKIDSDISVLYKSPVHESGSGGSLTCLNTRYPSGKVSKKDSSILQEFASGSAKSEVTVEVQRCESVDQFVAEKFSREMKNKGEDDDFMEFAYSKVPSNSLNESEASEQSSKTNMTAAEEEAASIETNKNAPIASNSAYKLLTKAANFINELVRATDPAHGTPQADSPQEPRGNKEMQEEVKSTTEENSEVSTEMSVEDSTKDEESDEAASNKKSSTKSIEFRLELNVEYQPVDQADSRDSIESEIELSPVTATRFELDNIIQIAGSGTETDDEDSSKTDAKDLTLKNSVSSRILHRKKTQTWKSNTAIQDPDSKESLMPLEIITVKAPATQVSTGKPALSDSKPAPDIPENKHVPNIPENKHVPNIPENRPVSHIPENKPVPNIPENKPVPGIAEKTEDEIIAEVLISHLKKDSVAPTQVGSEGYRVDVDVVEPKRVTKKLIPSNRSNRKHTPTEAVNHVVVEYHDNVSVWEGADITIPIVYDQDSPEDLQEPSPPSHVEIIRIDNLPSLSASSPEDEKQLHGFISSVLKLHDIVQAQQKTEASEDKENPTPSSKYFNRDVYEYLYKNTGSSTSVTSSTSTVKSSKGPNETTAPYAWKWKSPTKDLSSHDVQEEKPKLKRRSARKTVGSIVAPVFDSPSDTSSLASWASSTLQRRRNDNEKKKFSTVKTSGDDNDKDSTAKKTYFRSSTAERLAMPKGASFLQDTEFSGLVSTFDAIVRRKTYLNRDSGCKSAGTVMVGTQTPRENERLLTPTLLRKKLNSAKQNIAASSTQTPRVAKAIPNLDLTRKLPLVPKSKVESGVQTSEPVKKVEKVVKEKPTTSAKGIKPKIAKTIKELSLKTSSDEESVIVPSKTSATTELDKRAGRSALKSAVTSQPKKPAAVRFVDASVGGEPTGTTKATTGQQVHEKVKDVNIQDLPGRPASAASSAAQVKAKGRQGQGGKLKKVKVSSTRSADHIGLTYRRRSASPGKKSPRSRSRSKSKEFSGYKLDTFSNVTMIAPSAVPPGVEYVDLNIIVRRKDLEGNYPSIEELVQEVGGDNFCLVLDQDAPLKSRRLQVQNEKKVTHCGKPGDVCQKTFLSFLPQLRCPTPNGKPFFRIPFGKIPVVP